MDITLREFMVQHFDLEELRTLCFDLHVEYDDLRGEGRAAKVRELIALMERVGRLDDLVEAVRRARSEPFEQAGVIVERERVRADLEAAPGAGWWRWDWQHVGPLALILLLVGVVVFKAGPWGRGPGPATATPPSVAGVSTPVGPSATPSPSPSATPTPSPTVTPSPTSTPTPSGPPADVLIAEFSAPEATAEAATLAYRLETDLQDRLRRAGLSDVTVRVIANPIANEDQARSLASERKSKAVIWGWYHERGIQVRIFLAGGERAWRDFPATNLVPLERDDGSRELAIVVEEELEELADDVSFLSLFVIGHLHYLANEYQAGHAAFDAAMENMPVKAELHNKALIPFFEARQLEAGQSDDVTGIVCRYAQAIELDPTFAEPYNNLGIISARNSRLGGFGGDWFLSEEGRACLARVGLEGEAFNAPALFDMALDLHPDWAIAEFNKLAFYWQNLDQLEQRERLFPFFEGIERLKEGLEAVLERDPSIPGAYVVLGTMALEEGDFPAASRWYSSALALMSAPESAGVHFNLGYVYLHDGQEERAEAEFEAALVADADEAEAHLALANLALRRGERESAMGHLEAILPLAEGAAASGSMNSPGAMAVILKSRAHFDVGERDVAIETLEQFVRAADEGRMPDMGSMVPLQRYLLGLMYTLNGDPEMASTHWDMIRMVGTPFYDSQVSSSNAWYDVIRRCDALEWGDGISDWDAAGDPCLPTDLEERIGTVYDLFHDRLSGRYYYRSVYYGPLACPYVFTYDDRRQAWRWDTTILYELVGREREALQRRRLARFDGRLLIREVEPEVSYIDQLYVLVVDGAGQEVALPAPLAVLQEADGRYLVLHPGDELALTFDGYRAIGSPRQAWVVAEGYYVPLLSSPRE